MLGKSRSLLYLGTLGICLGQSPNLPVVYSMSGELRSDVEKLDKLEAGTGYSFLFSVDSGARVAVSVMEREGVLLSKTLHAGDSDLYGTIRPRGAVSMRVSTEGTGTYRLQINRAAFAVGANHTWQNAAPITLGQLVTGSSDEQEYFPLPETSRKQMVSAPEGDHWYRFDFAAASPKLVFFQLELTDRDDLPVDVAIFRSNGAKLEEYTEGQDPVALSHEVQALPGNKFAPRILREKGEYYVRVRANHPEFKLRTRVYDAPPYQDPRDAVRTAVDYIMGAGDSWFANTPRRGGAFDRVAGVHQETSLCVACHASHFSQRAQLYSIAAGYPLVQRQQLQFLEERFYNNPRPFYGFEKNGAVWSRVISAPANVLSRMSVLTSLFEENVSGVPRPAYHQDITAYLKLYYAGREKLPPDETNGNTPLVSAHEVAWYSWKTTRDPRIPEMIAEGEVKNLVDLCYQTLALAEIDREKYAPEIRANAGRLLELQRPSGQWSMRFDAKEPEVEFQTGHALWALAAAGVPKENPQVAKAIDYLMKRQQAFGGWMDPTQSFENFKTPFRETQFAVLALSSYFPGKGHEKGWDAAAPKSLSPDPEVLLTQLDQIWDAPSDTVLEQTRAAAQSNETLIRQAAVEALGRLALSADLPLLVKLLEDPSKLVQRTAAWSIRQVYAAHPESGDRELLAALGSPSVRLRWGATRVFAHSFASLARRNELITALDRLAADPAPAVRMQAIRGLWQAWFWNANPEVRGKIEDTVLAGLGQPQHPWVESNLRSAVYNLADENIRYLYNNWVALLGKPEDRERAIQGRLAVESQLAVKFAAVLEKGAERQKKQLLAALAEIPLRRGDVYELSPPPLKNGPPVYSRIGNDIEQIAFFGSSAAVLSRALLPLLDAPDQEMQTLARNASLIVRETPYTDVERAAGGRNEATLELAHKLDGEGESAAVARAFHLPAPRSAAAAPKPSAAPPTMPLDEAYFHANIDPILQKKGSDGYACVNCHVTHTLFNATWSTVKNVVDSADPENSLLLRKPTSTAESEGVAGAVATAHGGGQRWMKNSPEYETILKWLQGAH
uniref:HEAT domain containing protein n=1 Tax=Solibacter usitatus (strain Ellin6076) TaxID=234267 RepID=Q01P27_SOLUE